jgi:hypothetical protein
MFTVMSLAWPLLLELKDKSAIELREITKISGFGNLEMMER